MLEVKYYPCRICGLLQEDPPWGEDDKTPSFEICACCGVEFGYEDINFVSIRNYRARWLEEGAEWFDVKAKPMEWNLEEQLKNIPSEFL
jgi:hypothetical protein